LDNSYALQEVFLIRVNVILTKSQHAQAAINFLQKVVQDALKQPLHVSPIKATVKVNAMNTKTFALLEDFKKVTLSTAS
tara:strand:- start:1346 stop:1582 length:237 start_codon:yes stop_codon:yes gene_type:complete